MLRSTLALPALLLIASPVAAAATQEGADQLVATFHRYLGPAPADGPDFVRATPDGEGYRLSLDFATLAKLFEPAGIGVSGAELALHVAPLPDGTWQLSDLDLPDPLTLQIKDQTMTYHWDGETLDAIYDPVAAAYVRLTGGARSATSETRAPQGDGRASIGQQSINGKSSIKADGSVDFAFHQVAKNFSVRQSMLFPPDAAPGAGSHIEFAYAVESGTGEVSAEALKSARLLDLYAYGIAHFGKNDAARNPGELRGLLTAALPVFRKLDESVAAERFNITSPVGAFGLDKVNFNFTFPGLVPDGVFAMSLQAAGFSYPSELAPPWAKQLVPDALDFGFELSGFDLDAPARHLIAALDPAREPPVSDADMKAAGALALPGGALTLKLKPTRIDGPLLDLAVDGDMTLRMPNPPSGTFHVTATGLDAAIAALQGATDPIAGNVLGVLQLAKTFGQSTGDGSLRYLIEADERGGITVNGTLVKPPMAAQPEAPADSTL